MVNKKYGVFTGSDILSEALFLGATLNLEISAEAEFELSAQNVVTLTAQVYMQGSVDLHAFSSVIQWLRFIDLLRGATSWISFFSFNNDARFDLWGPLAIAKITIAPRMKIPEPPQTRGVLCVSPVFTLSSRLEYRVSTDICVVQIFGWCVLRFIITWIANVLYAIDIVSPVTLFNFCIDFTVFHTPQCMFEYPEQLQGLQLPLKLLVQGDNAPIVIPPVASAVASSLSSLLMWPAPALAPTISVHFLPNASNLPCLHCWQPVSSRNVSSFVAGKFTEYIYSANFTVNGPAGSILFKDYAAAWATCYELTFCSFSLTVSIYTDATYTQFSHAPLSAQSQASGPIIFASFFKPAVLTVFLEGSCSNGPVALDGRIATYQANLLAV